MTLLEIGDRVEVGSVFVTPPSRWRGRGRRATGRVEAFNDDGSVAVRFDCGPVNGTEYCTAARSELVRIGEKSEEVDS